jgi:hypothetical protein
MESQFALLMRLAQRPRILASEKYFFQLPHHAVSTLTFALVRGSTTEIACKLAEASRSLLTSLPEYKISIAGKEYRYARARTNPENADRPRSHRPQPVHTLPQDARRYFSKSSSDQRALLRLA